MNILKKKIKSFIVVQQSALFCLILNIGTCWKGKLQREKLDYLISL